MKQLLLICAMVMGQSVLAADEKLIADPIVEKAIRRQIGKPNGGLTKVDLAKVTMLALRSTKITDAGLKDIAKLQELIGLWLNGTDITGAGLMDTAKLQKLIHLNLDGTKITDENAAELGKALPKCRIFHSYKKDEPAPSFLLPLLLPTPKQDGLNRKRSNGFA